MQRTFGGRQGDPVLLTPADRVQRRVPRVRPDIVGALPAVKVNAQLVAVNVADGRATHGVVLDVVTLQLHTDVDRRRNAQL